MIKKHSVILLHCITLASLLLGSLLYASEPQKKSQKPAAKTPATPKIPANRYNALAKDIFKVETPTTKAAEEFKKLIAQDQETLKQKPLCQQELDLVLEDFTARARVTEQKVRDNLGKLLIKREAMRKQGKTPPPLSEALEGQLAEIQKRYQPIEPTPTTPPAQKPPAQEQPKPTPQPEQPTPQQPPVQPQPEIPPVTPTPEPEQPEQEEETEEPTLSVVKKQAVSTSDLQLVQFVDPTLTNTAVAIQNQMLTLIKNPTLQPIIKHAANVVTDVLKVSPLAEQPKIFAIVEKNLAAATGMPRDRQLVIANATKQADTLTNRKITIEGLTNLGRIASVTDIKNDTLSITALQKTLQATVTKSNLSDQSKWLVEKLEPIFTTITQQITQTAPEMSTALIVAQPDGQLQKQLTVTTLTFDSWYHTLFKTTEERAKVLFDELKATKSASGTKKAVWYVLEIASYGNLGTSYREPEEIIRDLIMLLYMFQRIGGAVAYLNQKTIDYYGDFVDPSLLSPKEAQSLALTPYIKDYTPETNYMENFTDTTLTLYKNVETAIKDLADDKTKQELIPYFKDKVTEPDLYMTPAEKDEQNQSIENSEALTAPEEAPAKPIKPVIIEKPIMRGIKAPVRQPSKPTEKPTIKPVEPLEEEVPRVEEVTEEKPTQPQQTALPVIDPSVVQKFELLKKKIRDLDVTKINTEKLSSIQNELGDMHDAIIKAGKEKEFEETQNLIKTKFTQVDLIGKLNRELNIINTATSSKQSLGDDAIALLKENFSRAKNELGSTYEYFDEKLNRALNTYIQSLIKSMDSEIPPLNEMTENFKFNDIILIFSDMLLKVKDIPSTLKALKEYTSNHTTELENILIRLCVLYDAVVYGFYKPDKLKDTINKIKIDPNANPIIHYYIDFIKDVIKGLKDNDFDAILTNLSTILDINAFEKNELSLTALQPSLKKSDGTYLYAFPAGETVAIDDQNQIPTMVAITDLHKKEYLTILEQWKNRIEHNAEIKKLQTITPDSIKTMEDIETLKKDLESLKGLIPSSLYDELNARFDSKEFKTASSTIQINDEIADLLKLIQKATETFARNKRVTYIPFREKYSAITEEIKKHIPDKETDLMAPVLETYSKYLTAIAASYRDTLSTMPARGYAGDTELTKKFVVTISPDFTKMLSELVELNLIPRDGSATGSFETVYTAFMQGYGYILATIDAIQAKLVDEAEKKDAGWFGLFDQSSAQYKTLQTLLNLVTSTVTMRAVYYKELIEPYFSAAPLVTAYNQGNLELLSPTLGLTNLTEKNGQYIYARSGIKGYEPSTYASLILPSGKHKPIKPYEEIVPAWNTFIVNVPKMKAEAIATFATKIQEELDKTILNLPVFNQTLATAHENRNFYNGLNRIQTPEQAAPLIKQLNAITQALDNKKLLADLEKLKKEAEPKNINRIQTESKVEKICGNALAMLDGLIYAIYKNALQKNSDPAQKIAVGTIALKLQEPLQQLINAIEPYLQYCSADFKSFYEQAKEDIPVEKQISNWPDTEYMYQIGERSYKSLPIPDTPITYNNIKLFQIGRVYTEPQLKRLDALIKDLVPLAQRMINNVKNINNELNKLATKTTEIAGFELDKFTAEIIKKFGTLEEQKKKLEDKTDKQNVKQALNKLALTLITTYKRVQ